MFPSLKNPKKRRHESVWNILFSYVEMVILKRLRWKSFNKLKQFFPIFCRTKENIPLNNGNQVLSCRIFLVHAGVCQQTVWFDVCLRTSQRFRSSRNWWPEKITSLVQSFRAAKTGSFQDTLLFLNRQELAGSERRNESTVNVKDLFLGTFWGWVFLSFL